MDETINKKPKPDFSMLRTWLTRLRSDRYWLKLYAIPIAYVIIWLGYYAYGILVWYALPAGSVKFPGESHGWFAYYIIDYLRTAAMINLVAIPALVAFPELKSLRNNLPNQPPADQKKALLNLFLLALRCAALPAASIILARSLLIGIFYFKFGSGLLLWVSALGIPEVFLMYGIAALGVVALAYLGVLLLDVAAGAVGGAALSYALYAICRLFNNGLFNAGRHLFALLSLSLFGRNAPFFHLDEMWYLLDGLIFGAIVWGLLFWLLAGRPRISATWVGSLMPATVDWLKRHFSSAE